MQTSNISLIAYTEEFQPQFKALNEAWIKELFTMEQSDYQALDEPERYIIEPGGYIVMALLSGTVVGTCALVPKPNGDLELAKMAVDKSAQGHGVGKLIAHHLIDKAKQMGCKRVFLESNTKLTAAIELYRKLGFVEIPIQSSCYDRVDIQMELFL